MTDPKFTVNTIVNGKHYGRFAIVGHRWSDQIGERIYGVIQVNEMGEKISREMNLTESCLA